MLANIKNQAEEPDELPNLKNKICQFKNDLGKLIKQIKSRIVNEEHKEEISKNEEEVIKALDIGVNCPETHQ